MTQQDACLRPQAVVERRENAEETERPLALTMPGEDGDGAVSAWQAQPAGDHSGARPGRS